MRSILLFIKQVFWNGSQRRLRALWRILVHFIAMIILLILSAILLEWSVRLAGIDPVDTPMASIFGVIQTLVMGGSVLLSGWLLDRRSKQSFGIEMGRRWNREFLLGFAMGAVAMSILFGIEYGMGWVAIKTWGVREGVSLGSLLLAQFGWLLLMFGVGISEELLSRGYHLKNMAEGFRRLGYVPAVVLATLLSSSVFGLLHMGNPNATLVSGIGILLAGLMLAMGRITTGSLAAPIGLHMSWNYFQGSVFGFAVSGTEMKRSVFEIEQKGNPLWTGGAFGPEAGLLGFIAIGALIACFMCWPGWSQRRRKTVVRLARYRRGENSGVA